MSNSETNPLPFHPQADIIDRILKEVKHLRKYEPWPDHVCGQAGRVTGPAGQLATYADGYKYKDHNFPEVMVLSAIRTAANAIRFIENFQSPKTIKTNDTNRPTDTETESAENIVSENPEG